VRKANIGRYKAAAPKYPDAILVRMGAETLARIDDVLERFENRSHMVREAIEREIKRRKRQQPK